jgi:hypothetical protein
MYVFKNVQNMFISFDMVIGFFVVVISNMFKTKPNSLEKV